MDAALNGVPITEENATQCCTSISRSDRRECHSTVSRLGTRRRSRALAPAREASQRLAQALLRVAAALL